MFSYCPACFTKLPNRDDTAHFCNYANMTSVVERDKVGKFTIQLNYHFLQCMCQFQEEHTLPYDEADLHVVTCA